MLPSVLLLLATATTALSCALHTLPRPYSIGRRQSTNGKNDPGRAKTDWAYDESYNWARLKPEYGLCQTGTQQAPIALSLTQGLSQNHNPSFAAYEKSGAVPGTWFNWGYGPAFTLDRGAPGSDDEFTNLPNFTFDNDTTVYLLGWHIHSPAEHAVDGYRSRAELHMVHVDARGRERAVVSIRLDPQGPATESGLGGPKSAFLEQLPALWPVGSQEQSQIKNDPSLALRDIGQWPAFRDNTFWTYQGSLTSPPCREGLRWFVARDVLYVGMEAMRNVLGNSSYGARTPQTIWEHGVNV